MSLTYPPFDRSEYSFLNQDLSVVDYALKLRAIDREIESLNSQLVQAKKKSNTCGKGLMKSIVDEVKAYEDFSRPDLKREIEEYRRCVLGGNNPGLRERRDRAVARILRAASVLDTGALETFFKAEYATEIAESAENRKEVQSIVGKIKHYQAKSEELLDEASKVIFRDGQPVETFKGEVGCPRFITQRVMETFCRDWETRAKQFEVPVTIGGIGIHTMPTARKVVWHEAYRKLGLDKLKRRPVFQFFVAPVEMEVFAQPTVLRGVVDNAEVVG